jgi:hypothetical protein
MAMTQSPSRKQLREFGFLLAIGFPLLLGWLLPALRGHGFHTWTLWIAIPGLTFGLLAPRVLGWPYRGWMALGHALGWFNSHIILGAVFLLVLQPIAFVMRLTGYDPLRRRQQKLTTYREVREHKAINLTRIF